MRSTQGKPYSQRATSKRRLNAFQHGSDIMTIDTAPPNTDAGRVINFPGTRQTPAPVTAHTAPSRKRAARRSMAGHRTLMRALDHLAEIAEDAPLSFLLVQVDNARSVDIGAVLALSQASISPMDRAAVYGPTQVGIILQGAGATRAAQTASLLEHRINASGVLPERSGVRVSAATGTGENALVLPQAAVTSFDDCG